MKIYEFAISDKRGKELTEFWKDCLNNNYVRTEWKGIDNFKNININRDLWNLIDKSNPQYKNKRIPKEFTPRRCTLNEISFDTYQKLIEEKTREYIKAFIK